VAIKPHDRIIADRTGFEQADNAQAVVDTQRCWRCIRRSRTRCRCIEQLKALAKLRGRVKTPIADTGYASQNNVNAREQAKIPSLISLGRQTHKPSLGERFAEPTPLHGPRAALEAMSPRFAIAETNVRVHHKRLVSSI
jgi:hypothetical protein